MSNRSQETKPRKAVRIAPAKDYQQRNDRIKSKPNFSKRGMGGTNQSVNSSANEAKKCHR